MNWDILTGGNEEIQVRDSDVETASSVLKRLKEEREGENRESEQSPEQTLNAQHKKHGSQ
jgi:hypothetical protein